jgi:GNAT acetyltransferase-like protein
MHTLTQNNTIIKDLSNGLVLRHATAADADKLADFNAHIHGHSNGEPEDRVGAWTRDLLAKPHPTFKPGDFTIVEEQGTGRIVSSLNHISQVWTYAGIPVKVGRPELVGTLPEFRNRGLVRIQFDEIHKWSAERGELIQAITGIPYYYRQFGYAMAMELDGGRAGYEPTLPQLKEGEAEPYRIRPATESDIPFLMEVEAHAQKRNLVGCLRDAALWRYELTGKSERNVNRFEVRMIERAHDGEKIGYLTHPWFHWERGVFANGYELKPGVSWLDVTPSVARYLWAAGDIMLSKENKHVTMFGFWFGESHPTYEVFQEHLPRRRQPYAWYLRVPDLPAFIQHIAPALEKRIAESFIPGHSGEIKLGFYRGGLRMVFERGKLVTAENWNTTPSVEGDAAFPNLTFLELLFGYRKLDELAAAYADCWYDNRDEVRILLTTLFPKQRSHFFPIS